MPCRYDPTPDEIAASKAARLEKERLEKENQRKLQRELDRATRLLCEVMRSYDLENPSAELQKWWQEHEKKDAARLKREKRISEQKRKQKEELKTHSELLKKLDKAELALLKKHGLTAKGK